MAAASFEFDACVLIDGSARGVALRLTDTLSFWGGFDPIAGSIIDVHHPQYRAKMEGKVLLVPRSRGSAGTPGGIAECLRNGSGPSAFVLAERDVNIGVGCLVANQLYGLHVPVLRIAIEQMQSIASGDMIDIIGGGKIRILRPAPT